MVFNMSEKERVAKALAEGRKLLHLIIREIEVVDILQDAECRNIGDRVIGDVQHL